MDEEAIKVRHFDGKEQFDLGYFLPHNNEKSSKTKSIEFQDIGRSRLHKCSPNVRKVSNGFVF